MSKNKDIYEHLAKVYFDPASNKSKDPACFKSLFKNLFKLGILVVSCLVIVLMVVLFSPRSKPKSQLSLILENNITRINYDFNQAKKEAVIFDLKDMDLSDFESLCFRARKTNYQDDLHMCVEFISGFAEKSQIYLKQIPRKWQNFKINLVDFENIKKWSDMRQLLFVVEEWNAQAKKGIVYIDNVSFLK